MFTGLWVAVIGCPLSNFSQFGHLSAGDIAIIEGKRARF